jgi:uncharacterized protein YfeS
MLDHYGVQVGAGQRIVAAILFAAIVHATIERPLSKFALSALHRARLSLTRAAVER